MSYRVEFAPNAHRQFRRLPTDIQKRMIQKMDYYLRSGQNPLGFAKPLINLPPATHRFRIGKYRACFFVQAREIIITAIDTREDIYRK